MGQRKGSPRGHREERQLPGEAGIGVLPPGSRASASRTLDLDLGWYRGERDSLAQGGGGSHGKITQIAGDSPTPAKKLEAAVAPAAPRTELLHAWPAALVSPVYWSNSLGTLYAVFWHTMYRNCSWE